MNPANVWSHGVRALERVDESPAFFRLAVALQSSADRAGAAIGTELTLIGLDVVRILEDLVDEGTRTGVFRADRSGPGRFAHRPAALWGHVRESR